jgi:hypothetical protein
MKPSNVDRSLHDGPSGRDSRNVMPGFGRPVASAPPPGLDYDLWLGPAPARPYSPHRGLYHFRWFWDYSGGQMTNLGGETPDTQDALFDFPGLTAVWSHREASRGENAGSSLAFYGTKGSLGISRSGFTVTPDPIIRPEDAVPQFTEGQPVGGVQRSAQQQERRLHTEPVSDRTGNSLDQFRRHARNFLDCIQSRQTPVSDLESAHRVATLCHLANASLRLGRSLQWDAGGETVRGDDQAAALLERSYRPPWDTELRSVLS